MINGFGERLRQLRKTRHQTQTDIARICGVSREAVSQWEKGKTDPSCSNVIAIVSHYDYCYKWLLEGRGHVNLEEVRRQLRHVERETGVRLLLDDQVKLVLVPT